MTTLRNVIKRSLLTLAVIGLGLAATSRPASADVVFEVDDSVVPGTVVYCGIFDCTFDTDKISGFYRETLTINPDFTFDASAKAVLDSYSLAGAPTGPALVGCVDTILTPWCYDMFAVFTGSGSVNPGTGVITFSSAEVTVYIDPSEDDTFTDAPDGSTPWGVVDPGLDDIEVISSTTLLVGTGILVPPTGGFFDLTFGDLVLSPFGSLYWDLDTLSLTAVVDGDFDKVPSPPVPDTYTGVQGELSVVYEVPEPATLSLLGFGLISAGAVARRRRRAARNS